MKILLAVDGSEYTARMLDHLAARGIEAEFAHKVGHPADEIAAFAEHGKFDLVIMGSRGHGALANLVVGSVAMKVLAPLYGARAAGALSADRPGRWLDLRQSDGPRPNR